VIRTKPAALFVKDVPYHDGSAITPVLEREIEAYARAYDAYFARMCAEKSVRPTQLDPWPRVVLLPGVGLCAVGKTREQASIAADIYEHTIDVMTCAADIGAYTPVGRGDLFDVEYWSLEQAKLKKVPEAPLAGRIALVTGAASGIGKATARRLLEGGAHVAIVDHDADGLEATYGELAASKGHASRLIRVAADVTSWSDVRRAVGQTVRAFGGLDLVVSNAGSAPEGRLDTAAGDEALRRSLDLNLLAHNQVARAAVEVMLAAGRGGCLLFNASKSAFNQGPGFGPYAVAKAALIALMRQYAVDLGPHGVRANAVNADRIRTALFGGGVVESRAKARGLEVDDYFRANLLAREVLASDVADAFAYLASARATTGSVLTVDGGNAAAFPR
jgi:NAD(P)-dependent dehydrogenase (short-subunit alcohol dehydrogenase family)